MPELAIAFDETDVLASIVKESFFDFVQEFWDVIIKREPVWNWHIKYLCDRLQWVVQGVLEHKPARNMLINVPPGSTKSTICSIMFPPWVWTIMPEAQFIAASYSFLLSSDLSLKCRDITLSEKYRTTFPNVVLRPDQAAKTNYKNTEGGFRVSVGTGGVTGFHGHFIIVDDPLDPNKALSEAELLSANMWVSETLSQRKVDKAETPTILIMQRLHQDDPSARFLKFNNDVEHICLPAEITEDVKPNHLRDYYQDGLLDPIRLPRKVLDDNQLLMGEYGYAGQFLQKPVPRGGGMFKTDRITIEETAPTKWLKVVRYWDKAGTKDAGAYTAGVKMGLDRDKHIWILDVVRGRWDSAARENKIKQTTMVDGADVKVGVEQEPGSGGKESAENTAKNLMGYIVVIDRPTGDKTQRADPFSTQVNSGNVSMVRADWNRDYLSELEFFPMSTYKDQVDCSSGGFNMLVGKRKRAGVF